MEDRLIEKKMDVSNSTLLSCGFPLLLVNPANLSSDFYAVFIVRTTVNVLTCPVIILLNILVIVAVKTKQRLRTTSNIARACLATTDVVVGLIVQPLHIASSILFFEGKIDTFCSLTDTKFVITLKFVQASLHHLLLMSLEQYVAIKHPFAYEIQVTERHVIFASGLAWTSAIFLPIELILIADTHFVIQIAACSVTLIKFSAIFYFNVSIYKEIRRSEKQVAANQVCLEAKRKILKNKKAFYTTIIVLLTMFLCYVPVNICSGIFKAFKEYIPTYNSYTVLSLVSLLPILNSLFNPLIYTIRITSFRIAFIELLLRKTASQAEELERKIFGPRQIGVIADVEQRQNIRASPEQQVNEALNNGHETTV